MPKGFSRLFARNGAKSIERFLIRVAASPMGRPQLRVLLVVRATFASNARYSRQLQQ